jgi:hypothetical protein
MRKMIPPRRPRAAAAGTDAAAGREVVPLGERIQAARDRVAQQHDPALLEMLSDTELAANRQLAERIRAHERREQLARIETAAAAAERVRRTAAALADREASDLLRAERAIAEQRHSSSPHAKLARLHRRKTLTLAILTAVVGFAMLFSAVTVQHNIAPTGGPSTVMWWLSYGLETLISGMLVALMLSSSDTAEWGVIDEPWKVHGIEAVLLALTVTLNVYPYMRTGNLYGIGVHAIAPITIGAALATHSVVAGRYGTAIEHATATVPEHEDPTVRLATLSRIGAVVDTATLSQGGHTDTNQDKDSGPVTGHGHLPDAAGRDKPEGQDDQTVVSTDTAGTAEDTPTQGADTADTAPGHHGAGADTGPGHQVDVVASVRRERAIELDRCGHTHGQIAADVGVSKRTVRRYLATAKDQDSIVGPAEPGNDQSVHAADPAPPADAARVWHNGLRVLPGGGTVPAGSTSGEDIIDAELVEDHPGEESGADYGAAHGGGL